MCRLSHAACQAVPAGPGTGVILGLVHETNVHLHWYHHGYTPRLILEGACLYVFLVTHHWQPETSEIGRGQEAGPRQVQAAVTMGQVGFRRLSQGWRLKRNPLFGCPVTSVGCLLISKQPVVVIGTSKNTPPVIRRRGTHTALLLCPAVIEDSLLSRSGGSGHLAKGASPMIESKH